MTPEDLIRGKLNTLLSLNPDIVKPVGTYVVANVPGRDLILALSLLENESESHTEPPETGLHFYSLPRSQVEKLAESLRQMLDSS